MSNARVWFAFALLSLIWGSSYLFIRIALRQLTPLDVVGLRLLFGAIGLGLIIAARRPNLRLPRRAVLMMAVIATLNTTVPFLLISWGEVRVPSGLAAVLNSTTPIFSILIAGVALHDEPITLPRIGGVVVGFAGVVLLISRDLVHGHIYWSNITSQGAIVVASLCYASSAVLTRKTLRGIGSMTIATYTVGIAATESILLSLIFNPPPLLSFRPTTWLAVLWLGVLGSAVAYLLYFLIIQSWGASRATLVTYMLPVVGLTLGAIFLHEQVDWRILAGSALVIAGVVLASVIKLPLTSVATPLQTGHQSERGHLSGEEQARRANS